MAPGVINQASAEPTPNDSRATKDPEVVKSSALPTAGTGFAFRQFNYFEVQCKLHAHRELIWAYLDSGSGMSLIDCDWLKEQVAEATLLTRTSGVKI